MAKSLPLRLSLVARGSVWKFLSVFCGRDNSFYVHPYRPNGVPWMTPAFRRESDGRIALEVARPIAQGFALNKISFHTSGYINLTDHLGKRHRDGVRGPAFGEMELPYDLATFVPCRPWDLPAVNEDRGVHANFVLPEEVTPFTVGVTVVEADNPPKRVSGPIVDHPVTFIFPNHRYALSVTLWPVKSLTDSEVIEWPAFPFFLLRVSA